MHAIQDQIRSYVCFINEASGLMDTSLKVEMHVCHKRVSVVSYLLENRSLFSLRIPTIRLLTALSLFNVKIYSMHLVKHKAQTLMKFSQHSDLLTSEMQ